MNLSQRFNLRNEKISTKESDFNNTFGYNYMIDEVKTTIDVKNFSTLNNNSLRNYGNSLEYANPIELLEKIIKFTNVKHSNLPHDNNDISYEEFESIRKEIVDILLGEGRKKGTNTNKIESYKEAAKEIDDLKLKSKIAKFIYLQQSKQIKDKNIIKSIEQIKNILLAEYEYRKKSSVFEIIEEIKSNNNEVLTDLLDSFNISYIDFDEHQKANFINEIKELSNDDLIKLIKTKIHHFDVETISLKNGLVLSNQSLKNAIKENRKVMHLEFLSRFDFKKVNINKLNNTKYSSLFQIIRIISINQKNLNNEDYKKYIDQKIKFMDEPIVYLLVELGVFEDFQYELDDNINNKK